MKYRLMQWLACPACGARDLELDARETQQTKVSAGFFSPSEGAPPGVDLDAGIETEVMEGVLRCPSCGATFEITDGIPRMLVEGGAAGPQTAHRWSTFDTARPAWEESFLDYAAPLTPPDFLGKLVLDAGAGYGRHAFFSARYGAEVIAVDASADAVSACQANTASLHRVHVVQADLARLPFRPDVFDLVYSFGVLHHVDDPDGIFRRLGEVLRSGGRLSLWVYGPRQGVALTASGALRGAASTMPPDGLHRLSQVIAGGLRIFSHTPYRVLGGVPLARDVVSHLPIHDHHKWPFDVVVADIYDRLRVPVKHWFKGEQLEIMFMEGGYAAVHVSRRVGNSESFRATGLKR